jgi:hypothetical protein
MAAEHRIGRLLVGGLALILSAMSVLWFLGNFERRPVEVEDGLSAAALRNRFLAAERFLRRLDIPAEAVAGRDRLRELPPAGDVLVVAGLGPLNAQRREDLHRWLSAGGHLLVAAAAQWEGSDDVDDHPDDFLASYGVRLRELDSAPLLGRVEGEVDFEGFEQPLKVEFRARTYLEDAEGAATGSVAGEGQYRLLQYDVGEGMLTVASDLDFLGNARIGEGDHALLLALLASPGPDGKVWLLYDTDMPWLGALLWRSAPYALVSALCLVACLLWALSGRLGPLLPAPEPGRRDLLAHLDAGAHFLWRHGRGSRLTRVTRERVEQEWLRRHPVLRGLAKPERAAWIAARTDLAAVAVERALYPPAVDEADLVADTALLQRLWTALSARVAKG